MTVYDYGYAFRTFYIPKRMMGGIERYVKHHIKPGNFLCSVISNDLKEACARADDENVLNLPAYVAYFYNEVPYDCWGSVEKIEAWIEIGNQRRANEERMRKIKED
jgi:hypothetical protein